MESAAAGHCSVIAAIWSGGRECPVRTQNQSHDALVFTCADYFLTMADRLGPFKQWGPDRELDRKR